MMDVMRSISAALIAMLVVATAACGDSPSAPVNLARFSQTDLIVGTGDEAVSGSRVRVN